MNRSFRNWLYNMYLDNCEEHAQFRSMGYPTQAEYFKTFKWWLKREYRYQKGKK